MELKKIQEFSVDELDSLAANINPGIEYEYAIYYTLLNHESQQYFRVHVLDNHPDKYNIDNIINNIDTYPLDKSNFKEVFIVTQNDNVGPSDIIVKDTNDVLIGFSVKYIIVLLLSAFFSSACLIPCPSVSVFVSPFFSQIWIWPHLRWIHHQTVGSAA